MCVSKWLCCLKYCMSFQREKILLDFAKFLADFNLVVLRASKHWPQQGRIWPNQVLTQQMGPGEFSAASHGHMYIGTKFQQKCRRWYLPQPTMNCERNAAQENVTFYPESSLWKLSISSYCQSSSIVSSILSGIQKCFSSGNLPCLHSCYCVLISENWASP